MKHLIPAIMIAGAALSASAATFPFTYNVDQATPQGYGYGRIDTYDICIRIDDPELAGATIKSLSVPIPKGGKLAEEAYAWVSASLSEDFTPESALACTAATMTDDTLTADFRSEIKVPAEGEIYVGYTVTIEKLPASARKFPIAVVDGTTPGSLYFRTTTHPNWDESFIRIESMSAMTIMLEKDVATDAASLTLPAKIPAIAAAQSDITATIINRGTAPIQNFEYILTSGSQTSSETITLTEPIEGRYLAQSDVKIPITTESEFGNYDLTLKITKVNGQPNPALDSEATAILRCQPSIPRRHGLIEEYTGLWCGQCPAGWVALETAADTFGSDFVAISYHINDDIATSIATPHSANSVPAMYLDRTQFAEFEHIIEDYTKSMTTSTDADINLQIEWTDASRSSLRANAVTTFMESHPGTDYRITLALVADHLKSASWKQANYFAGQNRTGKYWDIFTQDGSYVSGLEFNSIACIFKNPQGEKGSIPSNVDEFQPYSHEEIFNLSDAITLKRGISLIQNKGNLRVIAILLDAKTGSVINAISSDYSANAPVASGVDTIGADDYEAQSPVTSTIFFDLTGSRIPSPLPGQPCIRRNQHADGTISHQKIIVPTI